VHVKTLGNFSKVLSLEVREWSFVVGEGGEGRKRVG